MRATSNVIRLYTDWNIIQDNPKYILDNEAFFNRYKVIWDEFAKNIVNLIDKGTFCDEFTFNDRLGVRLYNSNLSTGTKTLLNIYSYPDYIFDFRESGDNCLELFLTKMVGSIYVPNLTEKQVYLLSSRKGCRFFLNDIEYQDFMEVVEAV